MTNFFAPLTIWIISKNQRYAIYSVDFYTVLAPLAVNAEPWEPENNPSRQLLRNGRLGINFNII